MKQLMMGLVLVAATAAPAFAASSTWESWNRPAAHDRSAYTHDRSMRSAYVAEPGHGAYAAAPGAFTGPMITGTPPVFAYGDYQGNDPDPFIRQSLVRDPPTTNAMQ